MTTVDTSNARVEAVGVVSHSHNQRKEFLLGFFRCGEALQHDASR
jgi:hypothetical protein